MGQAETNYKAEEADLVADTGANKQEVRRRALKGIPTKWAPVMGAVSGFTSKDTDTSSETGGPSTATPPSADANGEVSSTAELIRRLGN